MKKIFTFEGIIQLDCFKRTCTFFRNQDFDKLSLRN